MTQLNKTYPSFDLVKWLMAICVIAIHTHPLERINNSIILSIYNFIVDLAVPFFFIVSGFLLFSKMEERYNSLINRAKIRKYLFRMLKLYIVWNIIYFPISVFGFMRDCEGVIKSVILYIRNLLIVGANYYSWPLWYLLSLCYATVLVMILLKWNVKVYQIMCLSILIFIIACFITAVVEGDIHGGGYERVSSIIRKSIGDGRILTGFTYFSLGMFLARYKIRFSFKASILGMTLIVFVALIQKSSTFCIAIPKALFFFELVLSIKLKERKCYIYFRHASEVLYFSHMIFFFLWSIRMGSFEGENQYSLNAFIWTFILSNMLSWFTFRICHRQMRIIKLLFG